MAQLNESYQTPTKSPSEPIPEWRRGRESKAAKSFFQMSLCIDFSVSSLSHVGEFPACSVISEIGTPGHRSDCQQMRSVAGWLRDSDSGSEHEHGESSPNRGMLFYHRFGVSMNAHVHLHLCMRACGSQRRIESAAARARIPTEAAKNFLALRHHTCFHY